MYATPFAAGIFRGHRVLLKGTGTSPSNAKMEVQTNDITLARQQCCGTKSFYVRRRGGTVTKARTDTLTIM